MTTTPALDPEGIALVNGIHARKLTRDLAAAQANHDRLVSEAAALGVKPGARFAWELVHEAAGITAQLQSRLTQQRWTT